VRTGGPIPVNHLSYLIKFFHKRGLEFVLHDSPVSPDMVQENQAYVSCDMNIDDRLAPVRDSIYQVQLAHNLSGLKGSSFWNSSSDLNVLPGRRITDSYGLDLSDSRVVISGYPKWDVIYHERFLQNERRQEIASDQGLDPDFLWICFYPTGPNEIFKGNLEMTFRVYERLRRDIGEHEFIVCDHARNRDIPETQQALKNLKSLAQGNARLHIVDGRNALPYISACDLFISDISSSIISAISMHKPIMFIGIEHGHPSPGLVKTFQCGPFFGDIADVRKFIQSYEPPSALLGLFDSCVRYDDDRNCERITNLILERYNRWLTVRSCRKILTPSSKRNSVEVSKLKQHQQDDLIVVVKSTNRCNASCLYCASTKGIYKQDLEIELLRRIYAKLSEYVQLKGIKKITFLWQRFNVGVGTSVDPIGKERISKDGRSQYPDWLEKFLLASEGRLRLGIVFTVLSGHLNRVTDIYNFFRNLQSLSPVSFSLRINPVYATVKDSSGLDPGHTVRPTDFGDFIYGIWKLWDEDGRPFAISPLLEWSKGRGHSCEFSGSCHQRFLSVDGAGDIYHCGRFADTGPPLNNILDTDLVDILLSHRRLEFRQRAEKLKASHCKGCPFWRYCKGGCPYHAYISSGDIFNPSPFCQGYKRFFEKVGLSSLGSPKKKTIDV